jgi:integrase/recombinase XerD
VKQDLALIEQFLDALWLERNLAENTLSAYRRDLTMLVEWLHHRGLSLASVGSDDLQALLAERQSGGYKATSTARLLSAVRRFFQHLYREKFARTIPARCWPPKLPQRLPKDLSEAQVERLLQAPLVEQPLELRDKAMLEVLYATGLRVSELVGLTMSDISLRQGVLRVVKATKSGWCRWGRGGTVGGKLPRVWSPLAAERRGVGCLISQPARPADDAPDLLAPD